MRSTASDINVRIGTRIRALRGKRNLTLDSLACRAQVSRAMLSRVERGESSPTAQFLGKVCGGLGVTLSVLFSQTQRPVSPLSRRQDQPTSTRYLRPGVSPAGTGASVDIGEVEILSGGSFASGLPTATNMSGCSRVRWNWRLATRFTGSRSGIA
jgi:transcriptional regulator with XRE-family HTH domain